MLFNKTVLAIPNTLKNNLLNTKNSMQKMNKLFKKILLSPKKNSFFTLPYSTLNPNNTHLLFDRQQLKCMKNTMKKFLTP